MFWNEWPHIREGSAWLQHWCWQEGENTNKQGILNLLYAQTVGINSPNLHINGAHNRENIHCHLILNVP